MDPARPHGSPRKWTDALTAFVKRGARVCVVRRWSGARTVAVGTLLAVTPCGLEIASAGGTVEVPLDAVATVFELPEGP